ncbi:LamG domain-containing protein [Planktothrix pseudagardhii]|nr:LamG domain-containing protein [Planktothrix pseudagardhii]
MYTRLSGKESRLLAYYPLGEAKGNPHDLSLNGNHGLLCGRWRESTVPISAENTVMQFDGKDDYLELTQPLPIFSSSFTISMWLKIPTYKRGILLGDAFSPNRPVDVDCEISADGRLRLYWSGAVDLYGTATLGLNEWHFVSFVRDRENQKVYTYIDGVLDLQHSGALSDKTATSYHLIGRNFGGSHHDNCCFQGCMADLGIWNIARTQDQIRADMYTRPSGKELHLVAYYPLAQIRDLQPEAINITPITKDLTGKYHARPNGGVQSVADNVLPAIRENIQAIMNNRPPSNRNRGIVSQVLTIDDKTLPIVGDALVSAEYSTVTLEPTTKRKVAIMRRFLGSPTTNGAMLLPDKRIETLELKWIGNAQFAPTLLGYIEGPPPVPSENLTLSDDYNGATSVELTMSEDVAFSWNRSQDSGLGATADVFAGAETEASAGLFVQAKIATMRAGFKGNLDFSYQFQNESNITSSSSLSMTDKLELRGTPEETTKFPHLGTRFIPKNIGYALVVSALADVFVTRLARSGKMVGYQVQPVDGIPPDVNTITFLMNPAYTMNGSLDGMTGSSATSQRFFKHVPEMRSQYGSLYPASYYRLKEAYDLKRQIEAEDKRRESYFSNFDVRLVDETSLNRNIDSGDAPSTTGLQREEDKPSTQMTEEEKKKAEEEKLNNAKADAAATVSEKSAATKAKQAEIQSKINDQEKRVQATNSFAGWQKRMEDLQIRAGKRNIVNTYVWDADGGLRTEAQSFANTVEHTIGGSFGLNAGLGFEGKFGAIATVELTAQATVNLTQTMSKTEARSKGFQLNVDLSGLEYKGITDYNDRPILPGEKVDRYRFMSFYLEGSTDHFHDFFNYVVDPEWLRSNDEEARALRQAQAGKPNKAWRVLHRVTYVERPALMGFGRDVRKLREASATSSNQQLLDKIAKLEEANRKLEEKLDKILNYLQQPK